MTEWNIQSRSHHCQACDKAFSDQQSYHTLLFDEKQQFRRMDVCEPCWQAQYSQGARDRRGFISYWQGTYEAPPPPAPEPIKRETAESLLRKLVERNDPAYAAASFILAVMLERKRLLKTKDQFLRDGQRIFLYEQPKTGDVFTIPDPNLQLKQLDQVQREVAALLEHGFAPPPQQAGAVPASSSEAATAPAEPGAPVSEESPSAPVTVEPPSASS